MTEEVGELPSQATAPAGEHSIQDLGRVSLARLEHLCGSDLGGQAKLDQALAPADMCES